MVYLTISTGIGGGAVIDGRLHRGAAGNGGEFGHVMVRTDGRPCLCGRRGCLEGYASGTSIALRAREAVAERGEDRRSRSCRSSGPRTSSPPRRRATPSRPSSGTRPSTSSPSPSPTS
ncbi:ROK family protein [Leifsonia sp. L25]|uniref:ROK family protein n=1 Tax=Leifsonia sp. L25 TaxID=3423957 RepID=UPI003D689AB8